MCAAAVALSGVCEVGSAFRVCFEAIEIRAGCTSLHFIGPFERYVVG